MGLFDYFQGWFLNFGLLDHVSITLNCNCDLVILCLRLSISKICEFKFFTIFAQLSFSEKLTTNHILTGHITFLIDTGFSGKIQGSLCKRTSPV